jgi:hypothetical protein
MNKALLQELFNYTINIRDYAHWLKTRAHETPENLLEDCLNEEVCRCITATDEFEELKLGTK